MHLIYALSHVDRLNTLSKNSGAFVESDFETGTCVIERVLVTRINEQLASLLMIALGAENDPSLVS